MSTGGSNSPGRLPTAHEPGSVERTAGQLCSPLSGVATTSAHEVAAVEAFAKGYAHRRIRAGIGLHARIGVGCAVGPRVHAAARVPVPRARIIESLIWMTNHPRILHAGIHGVRARVHRLEGTGIKLGPSCGTQRTAPLRRAIGLG